MYKRIKSFSIRFYGPHTPDLFKWCFVEDSWDRYDQYKIGTGESRAVAATRAVSHLASTITMTNSARDTLTQQSQAALPPGAETVEASSGTNMYCVIGVDLE